MSDQVFIHIGYINPLDIVPSFIVPVFVNSIEFHDLKKAETVVDELFWLQEVVDDKVVSFFSSDTREYSFLAVNNLGCRNGLKGKLSEPRRYHPPFTTMLKVGEPCIRGFIFPDGRVIQGDNASISVQLEDRLSQLEGFPYALADVHEYLDRKECFNSTLRLIEKEFAIVNEPLAKQWLEQSLVRIGLLDKLKCHFRNFMMYLARMWGKRSEDKALGHR